MLSVILLPASVGLLSALASAQTGQQADGSSSSGITATTPDLSWHAPNATSVNSLHAVINGTGVHGFIFNSSQLPAAGAPYGTYNWCNMPHVRRREYAAAPADFSLEYVEVIHRHHKRTPYAANTFPDEAYAWPCNDTALFAYGAPFPAGNRSAEAFLRVFTDEANPFTAPGFMGDCEFPQITHGGLDDSWQHGRDLYAVYHDLLKLIPDDAAGSGAVSFRVTNNVITSEVAGMLLNGMFGVAPPEPYELLVQSDSIDSLEPTYTCSAASDLYSTYGVGGSNQNWTAHLTDSEPLFSALDRISGVDPAASDWHQSWDHYFDNLSSRLCHGFPLPCNDTLSSGQTCVSLAEAEEVFRLGEYEYSYIYRDAPQSLQASTASFGVWVAELASHLRAMSSGKDTVTKYRHNVAHDGSLSRLLSILQIDVMVWPGMGSEVVFEMYKKEGSWFIRVLWGGQVLRSSNPYFGMMSMVPLARVLAYIDGLVGQQAVKVPGLCST